MNRELFSDAMNEIDSKYVEEALTYKPAKRYLSACKTDRVSGLGQTVRRSLFAMRTGA